MLSIVDVQVMGEKATTERVPEFLPVDPIVTRIRGDGRCHVAAIQAAKIRLDIELWKLCTSSLKTVNPKKYTANDKMAEQQSVANM